MDIRTHIYCGIGYFICAKFHASSSEHTKVYEVENGDNHSKNSERNKKKNLWCEDRNNVEL